MYYDQREFSDKVDAERQRQREKWGVQEHPHERWFQIFVEEVGEAAEAFDRYQRDKGVEELIQVVAVIKSWSDCFLLVREEKTYSDATDQLRSKDPTGLYNPSDEHRMLSVMRTVGKVGKALNEDDRDMLVGALILCVAEIAVWLGGRGY